VRRRRSFERPAYARLKRLIDVAGASVALAAFAPAWAAIAAAIKLTSPGPVLFRQTRLGEDGEPFTFLKFRSMRVDADDRIHREYVAEYLRGRASGEVDGRLYFKLRQDPRITTVGRFLRRTSLDEIPQLLNVLRGEMSLVGPRPPLPYEVAQYDPWHLGRLAAIPGITGYWQVYGRSRVSFDDMVRMDIDYIARASIWLDLKLMILTVPAMLCGEGAE
jgi:lipopolysaccharide/colanic/teichoic acid biosynthesis glycosyltransferase